ncbi:MAG: Slp family lipoprotein [Pseudomonadota bacterium]|nr:Slp family lipoprotein [Pseudomonadota bacterium]
MQQVRVLLVAVSLVAGCASQVPQAIREAPAVSVTVEQVQRQPTGFIGQPVRWGGTILAVHNRERVTEIELLARPLSASGEPRTGSSGGGRFLAEIKGFLDPANYPAKRLLTLAGRLDRVETRAVGEYPYSFPIVRADTLYLWPEPLPPQYPYPPYWYDPWYYPWYRPSYYPW